MIATIRITSKDQTIDPPVFISKDDVLGVLDEEYETVHKKAKSQEEERILDELYERLYGLFERCEEWY